MSAVEQARDHARAMSVAEHRPDCTGATDPPPARFGMPRISRCADTDPHQQHGFYDDFGIDWDCPGICPSCVSETDRATWARLADEYDAILGQLARMQEEQLW